MAQLQGVVEEVAHAQEPLAATGKQDRAMPRGMAGRVDDAHAGQYLGIILERAQPVAE